MEFHWRKKWSFPLRIFSVNVAKSAVSKSITFNAVFVWSNIEEVIPVVYEYSKCLVELLQVEPYDSAIAKTAVRQMHLDGVPADSVEECYWKALIRTLLDNYVAEMKLQISAVAVRTLKLIHVVMNVKSKCSKMMY